MSAATTIWHEDASFWEPFGPSMFSAERRAAARGEVGAIIELTGTTEGAAVLDMPCGVGRHALEFARRGFRVTGIDRTQPYLDEAGAQASAEQLDVELVQGDMRDFCRPGTYELALNLFTSFGYFDDPADERRVAENLRRSLKPGGALVMELAAKEPLARHFVARDWRELDDGSVLLEERKIASGWNAIESRWLLFRNGERYERSMRVRLYSAAELGALLKDVGFAAVAAYGGLDGCPYDVDALRLTMVARA
jgi:SAM-dependent methyltransferase